MASGTSSQRFPRTARLLKHADFERVYRDGKRHFSGNLTVFYLARSTPASGPRVGFGVGRGFGGAVDRNRIRRRLREAVRRKLPALQLPLDVVINPKRAALKAEYTQLESEIARAFEALGKGKA